MSLEATEDAQPGAVPEDESPPPSTAPAELGAQAAEPEPAGLSLPAEADGPAEPGEDEGPVAGGPPGPAGPSAVKESPAAKEFPAPDELAEAVELPEAVEPPELAGMAEPVQPLDLARRRRGLALAALFAVAALVIVGGAIGVVGALTHGFHKPVTVKYKESAVFKLHAGDCVSAANGQQVSVLPCTTPHQAEVFATFALPASAWPGTATVRAEASSGCASRLTAYLNPQLAISLAQSYVFPDQVAWAAGTRTVICEVQATNGLLTGSVRGS